VPVSSAVTIACFQPLCTGDSAADTMCVPICTPSAPSANAAAIETPSQIGSPAEVVTKRTPCSITRSTMP